MIHLILEAIGAATVLAVLLTVIKCILWDEYIRPLICEHRYKIQGHLKTIDGSILFLQCEKCGKERAIDISGNYDIIKQEEIINESQDHI